MSFTHESEANCQQMDNTVQITASCDEVMVDEMFMVLVSGLKGGQLVSIEAIIKERDMEFASVGCFIADENGYIDSSKQGSVSGTYTGVHTMGLIWSMQQAPGQARIRRLFKKDVCTPQIVEFHVYNGHYSLEQVHSHRPKLMASTSVKRWYKDKRVHRVPLRHGRLRGTLFIPPGKGPFPAVLDLFGTAGGLLEFRAACLASHGFLVLALAYFDYEDLPRTLEHLDLDYFKDAIAYLITHPLSYKDGVGGLGVSKGGELLQLLAVHCTQLKAVVSINGCPYLSFFPIRNGDSMVNNDAECFLEKAEYTSSGFMFKNTYSFETKHFFPVWDSEARFLSICGMDDQNTSFEVNRLQYDTIPQEKKHKFDFIAYKGAGHLIEPPYTPHTKTSYHKTIRDCMLWGGNAVDHAHAQEDSWLKIKEFLKFNIVPPCKHKQQSKL